jgi:endonuclease/exonuclease/phosphatase family metal-dependent hydrolase
MIKDEPHICPQCDTNENSIRIRLQPHTRGVVCIVAKYFYSSFPVVFMIINPKIFKNIIFAVYFLVAALPAQDLEDLSFGDENSLDIATWNIEWFPKNNQITVNYVIDIITLLDLDVLAIQELDDTDMFEQMLDSLTAYAGYYESNWFAGLAYIYKTETVEINDIYEIYITSEYWNAFPRSPMVMDFNFMGENYFIINNHFKCCGDGILDYDDSSDEENRRYTAINLLKEYIDNNLSNNNVIVLGDLNDDIAEPPPNNVFQEVLDDSTHYRFADLEIAQGNSSEWSFPNWPSHLDHILITDELFNDPNNSSVETIKIDEYLDGGWNEYDQNISDHRPVAIKFLFSFGPFYDLNDDGIINEDDFLILLSFIINDDELIDLADYNFDSLVDISDLLLLSDYLQDI